MTRDTENWKISRKSKASFILAVLFGITGGLPLALFILGTLLLFLHLKLFELLGFIESFSFSIKFLGYRALVFKDNSPPNYKEVPEEVH